MRKLAFLSVAFALVAVSFYGCDEKTPTDPVQNSPQTPLGKVAKGHATTMSTEGVPMAFLGGTGIPSGANGRGQVVGWDEDDAVIWENGVRTVLQGLGGRSYANAINDKGQVVGYSVDTTDGCGYAVIWENGSITKLSTLGGCYSYAGDINDRGQICGASTLEEWRPKHVVIWEKGKMVDLGFEGNCDAINNRGHIVGDATGVGAYLWADGQLVDLLPNDRWGSWAFDINERGQIVMEEATDELQEVHALIWDKGTVQDLGSLFGFDTGPMSLNNRGQVVGYSYTAGWPMHAFLWDQRGIRDLGLQDEDCAESSAAFVGSDGVVYGDVYCSGGPSYAVAWYP